VVLTAATAAMLAVSMPLNEGAAVAQVAPVEAPAEQVIEARPVRGQVTTGPDATGQASYWLTPLKGRETLEVQGQAVTRVWLGAVGSPQAAGLHDGLLGDVDLSRARSIDLVPTADGLEAHAVFAADAVIMDATTVGLPREVSGTVRLGAAPGAPGGSDADHFYLQLPEDAAVYLDGQRYTEVVHLGAADDPGLRGLQSGLRAELGARLQGGDTEHGPLAQVASVVSLATQGFEGAIVEPPIYKEGTFYSSGEAALPALTLADDGVQRDLLVIDEDAGRAFRGGLTDGGATFKGFVTDYALTRHLAGGPAFEIVDGAPTRDGLVLERVSQAAAGEDAEKAGGWYRDAASGDMFLLTFGADDAQVRATLSFTAP